MFGHYHTTPEYDGQTNGQFAILILRYASRGKIHVRQKVPAVNSEQWDSPVTGYNCL